MLIRRRQVRTGPNTNVEKRVESNVYVHNFYNVYAQQNNVQNKCEIQRIQSARMYCRRTKNQRRVQERRAPRRRTQVRRMNLRRYRNTDVDRKYVENKHNSVYVLSYAA